ncbi:MAG: hypothetical protein UY31_C0064G0009 [Candidatus Wolfebacteria bacterium GW2011_GWE1_48_7]|nr:MAG: hypothetical protein UY31_C0064G0009 [Candidatus Wolfebacteria bacterium GW2011_GWE1_48_7]
MSSTRPGSPASVEAQAVRDRITTIASRLKGIEEEIRQRNTERDNLLLELEETRRSVAQIGIQVNKIFESIRLFLICKSDRKVVYKR